MSSLTALALAALLGASSPSPQARAAFQRGEKALEAGQLDEAAQAYTEALKATPNYAEALNGLGSVLFRQGKRADAMAKFQAAIAADPGMKLAYFNLGYAARKNGDFVVAAQAYETYVKLDPSDPDGYYGLGESYRGQGVRPDLAIKAYETYISLENRPSEQRFVDKAKEYVAQLKGQQGSGAASAAVAAPAAVPVPKSAAPVPAPGSPAAAPPPGAAAPVAGAAAAAPSAVAAGGALAGGTAAALIAEGDRALAAGNASAAAQAYQSAVQLEPTNVEALFKQGNALAKAKDYKGAIEKWERVAQLSPDPATRQSAQQNVDKARARLAQASTPAPAAGTPQAAAREAYERGVRLVVSRNYAAAVQALTEALAADPTLAVAYTARGSANVGLRRFYEAAADYQDALRLDPTRASPLYGLAVAYAALGRTADARTYYERYASSTAPDVRSDFQATARSKSAAMAAAGVGGAATPASR
jgi:tetratricopeptide (TPR) repeat protein